ncbi:hypothetical protein [Propionicicella superfundia]|uniref:hypothetical protein n=1 Tax=Propionicicella superfundia TaxID=348582 RepID=UPI00048A9B30|nr:hypothetical protein [Propionicicella superfundia]
MFAWSDFVAPPAEDLGDDDDDDDDDDEADDDDDDEPEDVPIVPDPSALWASVLGASLAAAKGRVLLIGPEAARCLPLVSTRANVDVLVRSRLDSAMLVGIHPRAKIWCGSVARFEPEHDYDLVVGLDTFDVFYSTDEGMRPERETVDRVRGWAGAKGRLVLRMTNLLGLDRLLQVSRPGQSVWDHAESGLAYEAAVALDPGAEVAFVAGTPSRLFITGSAATDPDLAGLLTLAAASVFADEQADALSLQDPWGVVPDVVHSGDLLRLAPGWLLTRGVRLPRLAYAPDDRLAGTWQRSWRLQADEVGEITGASDTRSMVGPLIREGTAVLGGLRASESLEAVWRRAAATGEFERLRDEVVVWSAWLATLPVEQAFFAAPSNCVRDEEGALSLLDSTWRWQSGHLDLAKAVCLREFADRILTSGATHPWPASISLDAAWESLTLMAGVELTDDLLRAVVQLGVRIETLQLGVEVDVADELERRLDAGRAARLSLSSSWSRLESQAVIHKLNARLVRDEEQLRWCNTHIKWQDKQLNSERRHLASIQRSVPYKIARAMTWPGRAVIAAGKGVVVRALPPGAWDRIVRFAKARLRG